MDMSTDRKCPKCKRIKLTPLLTSNPHNTPVSYHCKKCEQEFYVCIGGELLTHKEFAEKKKDW